MTATREIPYDPWQRYIEAKAENRHVIPDNPSKSTDKHATQPLRHRTRAFWLLGFYVLLIFVAWVLTCVLAHRPVNARSYVRQQGFTDGEVSNMRRWKIAVDVLNSIAGLITIPVLSAILAQAAVLFCQRRKPDELLSLKDTFVIADRGWTNPYVVWNSLRTRQSLRALGRKSRARFLVPAACLIILGAIQQPLYQILVRVGTASVITCTCVPSWHLNDKCPGTQLYKEIGRDLEPETMAIVEHLPMLSRMISGLASLSDSESQLRLWSIDATYKRRDKWSGWGHVPDSLNYWLFQRKYHFAEDPIPDFFVAGVPRGTTTGVLRQHLMRLNSSVICDKVDPSDFPSPRPGDQPLAVSWQGVLKKNVRICVPGNYTAFPWALSRSRQDHIEEIYINVNNTRVDYPYWSPADPRFTTSYSIRCTATTTRGYFELGNNFNNNTYGPLLEQWPSAEQMTVNFDNWTDWPYVPSGKYTSRKVLDPPPLYVNNADPLTWKVPGPLMTSTLALFGRGSWLSSAANYVSKASSNVTDDTGDYKDASWQLFCRGMPFLNLEVLSEKTNMGLLNSDDFASACDLADRTIVNGDEVREEHVLLATHYLLAAFAPVNTTKTLINPENLLTAAMFVANQAFLTLLLPEAEHLGSPPGGRVIYTSPGVAVQRPDLSKTALIVLSLLIGLQLLGLGYLTYYLYRVPSWSDQLDAMAMARIGASLHGRGVFPAIGPMSKEALAGLRTVGGLIGIVEKGPRRKSSTARFVLPELATTGGLKVESQWLNMAEQGRENFGDSSHGESSMIRAISPDLANRDGSELEIQRLNPAEESRKSFEDGSPGAVSPNIAISNGSDAELQRLNSTEELRGSFKEFSTRVELGIGASGPILAADLPRRRPYVRAFKRAWEATFKSGKPSPVGDQ